MVFSSTPRLYLDPSNWQPQLGSGNDNSQLPPPLLPPPPVEGGGSQGLTRPVSMTDRARLAKLPQPEMALKCPRCESTNTKFCYFNNYSLSQPRHFCKTCRRYWTRGGALRKVPVGGGCRRSKRTKGSSRSKSPVTAEHQTAGKCSPDSTITTPVSSSSCTTDFFPHFVPHQPPQLPFMPSLHHDTDYGAGDHIGFNFGSDSAGAGLELPMSGSTSSGRFCEQWRLLQQFHQLPFSELPPPPGNFQFDHIDCVEPPSYVGGAAGQLGAVKSEEDQGGLNLSRNFLGMNENDEYWGGNINVNAWTTDLNVFTPSTTSHLL